MSKKIGDASIAQEDKGVDVLVASESTSGYFDRWVLDSGCSYHICPNRSWFSTYSHVQGGVILMGNDVACKITSIGAVKIRMFDGVIRTLANV